MRKAQYTEEQRAARNRMRREKLDRMQMNIAIGLIQTGEALKQNVESKGRIGFKR